MKKTSLLIALLCLFTGLQAQQFCLQVLNQAGGFGTSGNLSLSWSSGDLFVRTHQNSNYSLTEGFQQSFYCKGPPLVAQENPFPNPGNACVTLMRNPLQDNIDLRSNCAHIAEANFRLTDLKGRLLLQGNLEFQGQRARIDLPLMPQGIYFLALTNVSSKYLQYFKLIKTR